jgi:hypothetical protein
MYFINSCFCLGHIFLSQQDKYYSTRKYWNEKLHEEDDQTSKRTRSNFVDKGRKISSRKIIATTAMMHLYFFSGETMKFKLLVITGLLLLTSCSQMQSIFPSSLSDQEKTIGTFFAKTLCLSNEVQTSLASLQNKDDQAAIDQVTSGYQTKIDAIEAEAQTLGLNSQSFLQKFTTDVRSDSAKRTAFIAHVTSESASLCKLSPDNADLQSFISSMNQTQTTQQTQQVQPTQQGQ